MFADAEVQSVQEGALGQALKKGIPCAKRGGVAEKKKRRITSGRAKPGGGDPSVEIRKSDRATKGAGSVAMEKKQKEFSKGESLPPMDRERTGTNGK